MLLVFSYSDRASWEELPGLIQRTVMQVKSVGSHQETERNMTFSLINDRQDPGVLPVIVGNKYGNPVDNEARSSGKANW